MPPKKAEAPKERPILGRFRNNLKVRGEARGRRAKAVWSWSVAPAAIADTHPCRWLRAGVCGWDEALGLSQQSGAPPRFY
jgi:hypothetical protein